MVTLANRQVLHPAGPARSVLPSAKDKHAGPGRQSEDVFSLGDLDLQGASRHVRNPLELRQFAAQIHTLDSSTPCAFGAEKETPDRENQGAQLLRRETLMPALQGEILVAIPKPKAVSIQTFERRLHKLSQGSDLHFTCDPERVLVPERHRLIIVLGGNSRIKNWIDLARTIPHMPRIIQLEKKCTPNIVRELSAQAPAAAAFSSAASADESLKRSGLEFQLIQGGPGFLDSCVLQSVLTLVAKNLKARVIRPSLHTKRPWRCSTGFLTRFSPKLLEELLTDPGAALAIVSKGTKVLGYYLFFPDPQILPARGQMLKAALKQHGQSVSDSCAYCELIEITPAGRALGKIQGFSLYQFLHRHMLKEAARHGATELLGETRLFPKPSRRALQANLAHGWKEAPVHILAPYHSTSAKVHYGLTRILRLAVPNSASFPPRIELRSEPAGQREPPGQEFRTLAYFRSTQRLSPADMQQLLSTYNGKSFWIGDRQTSREWVSVRADERGYALQYRRWDAALETLEKDECYYADPQGKVRWGYGHLQPEQLLQLIRKHGFETSSSQDIDQLDPADPMALKRRIAELGAVGYVRR